MEMDINTMGLMLPLINHPDFFLQAKDGIRVKLVTGVQTCALPILAEHVDDPVAEHVDDPVAEHIGDPVAEHVGDPVAESATPASRPAGPLRFARMTGSSIAGR